MCNLAEEGGVLFLLKNKEDSEENSLTPWLSDFGK